jgi:hypothetical protein
MKTGTVNCVKCILDCVGRNLPNFERNHKCFGEYLQAIRSHNNHIQILLELVIVFFYIPFHHNQKNNFCFYYIHMDICIHRKDFDFSFFYICKVYRENIKYHPFILIHINI